MRILLVLLVALAALALLAPAGPSLAVSQGTHAGAIGGVVTTATGHPVPGAAVLLRGQTASGQSFSLHTRTNREGHFRFHRVPAGHYMVSARHPRAGSGREQVDLRPGEHVRIHIVLH